MVKRLHVTKSTTCSAEADAYSFREPVRDMLPHPDVAGVVSNHMKGTTAARDGIRTEGDVVDEWRTACRLRDHRQNKAMRHT